MCWTLFTVTVLSVHFKSWVYPYNPKLRLWILCWHTLNFTAASFSASKEQKWASHIFIHATQKEMGEMLSFLNMVLRTVRLPHITPTLLLCVYVCAAEFLLSVPWVVDAKCKFGQQFWMNSKGLAYLAMPHCLFLMRNCMHLFSNFVSLFWLQRWQKACSGTEFTHKTQKMSEVIHPVLQGEVGPNEVQIYPNLILVVYSLVPVLLCSHHTYCVVVHLLLGVELYLGMNRVGCGYFTSSVHMSSKWRWDWGILVNWSMVAHGSHCWELCQIKQIKHRKYSKVVIFPIMSTNVQWLIIADLAIYYLEHNINNIPVRGKSSSSVDI